LLNSTQLNSINGIEKNVGKSHNYLMSNGPEIANLNRLINEIKILSGSISILEKTKSEKTKSEKDQTLEATALDAINFRTREISKLTMNLLAANLKPTNFSIDDALLELAKSEPSSIALQELLEPQLETLRKWALSEILTLSIQ
jgi:hypothetical protein